MARARAHDASRDDLPITALLDSWIRHLEAANLSPRTLVVYRHGVARFARWLAEHGRAEAAADVTRADVEEYLASALTTARPITVEVWRKHLSQFFRWCLDEGEIGRSPMLGVRPVAVLEAHRPVLSDDDLAALLRACAGNEFAARRDTALVRLLLDCGLRRAEATGLTLAGVDLRAGTVTVLGKGRRVRTVAMRHKTVTALDRYLRIRPRHPHAALDALWLGPKGALTANGVYKIVRRRAGQAGLGRTFPHLFRHTFAHAWLDEGGSESGLMRQAGWRTRSMLDRYGAALAEERAREEAKRLRGGDRI